MTSSATKTTILVLGATGMNGKLIVQQMKESDEFKAGDFVLRLASRRMEQVDEWNEEGIVTAVYMDLDDPKTFGPALAGVDRIFILTGYTVDMLVQAKTLVDACVKAGVSHIVHLGVFGNWDTTDAHFAWHQLIETYIKASGINWTNLHPNYFMEMLLGLTAIRNDSFPVFPRDKPLG